MFDSPIKIFRSSNHASNPGKRIVIIGAGPGGLCAAMILAHRGFRVTIVEKQSEVGGRNSALHVGNYTFDRGPTFLLMRFIVEEMFKEAGANARDYLTFQPLDPMYRLLFDGQEMFISSDPKRMQREIRRVFPEADPTGLARFLENESKRYTLLYPCIQRDYSSLSSLFSKTLWKALPALALGHSVFSNLGQYFKSELLRLCFSFQSKYLGMSPWRCPALFTMLPLLEHRYGIEHVEGGLHQLSLAMSKVAESNGATVLTDSPVKRIRLSGRRATGVELEDGRILPSDALIINADFADAMVRLVPPGTLRKYTPKKLAKKEFSCSTFMIYLGLDKTYAMPHHTIAFSQNYRSYVDGVFTGTLSEDVSFYVQNASVTDQTLAPEGHSTLYILAPVPNNFSGIDWKLKRQSFRDALLELVMKRLNLPDLKEHIMVERVTTPLDWQEDRNVYQGATFNLSHKLSQLLYLRPRNQFEEIDQCYLVGGGTHPGSGLPTIYESARIVANMLSKQYGVSYKRPQEMALSV